MGKSRSVDKCYQVNPLVSGYRPEYINICSISVKNKSLASFNTQSLYSNIPVKCIECLQNHLQKTNVCVCIYIYIYIYIYTHTHLFFEGDFVNIQYTI